MAKSATTWEGRRAMTDNSSTSPEAYTAGARQLLEQDLAAEATIFFGLAGDDAGLGEIIDRAVSEGNFFVFQSAASRLKNSKVTRERVQDLIAAAEKNGRALYAAKAAEYLKNNF